MGGWPQISSPRKHKTRMVSGFRVHKLAEEEGFEPSIRETRMPDFESGAFNHSATPPADAKCSGWSRETQAASAHLLKN